MKKRRIKRNVVFLRWDILSLYLIGPPLIALSSVIFSPIVPMVAWHQPLWEIVSFGLLFFIVPTVNLERMELTEEGIRHVYPHIFKGKYRHPWKSDTTLWKYSEFNHAAIGHYATFGIPKLYIVFSKYKLSPYELSHVNKLLVGEGIIRARCTKKMYKQFMDVLPERQKYLLEKAIEKSVSSDHLN